LAKRKAKAEKRSYNRIKEVRDLDFQTITRYANNHRQPSIATLFEIAKVLKVNPRELINS
jgi:putative transcriptional regulator